MSMTVILFSIVGALLIGAISPGPSFVLVSRIAITASRLAGLSAALGMGLGGATFGILALLGLSALLMRVEWLYLALKLMGGAYLIYLGIRIWRGAREPIAVPDREVFEKGSLLRSFSFAFVTQISNPKTAVVYGSIFAALLPASPPAWMLMALPPLIFLVEAGWYAIVALAFSARHPRSVYLSYKPWIDRLAGAVMGGLGLRLIAESVALTKS
ncbi:threonine/homoserine/homoserine lactone efflux protein [Microvirga flocculans]|uniref:Threonine/homoserine/homoserine lactone efflux protein n=1 Tax=Microvirga flocculans TaxID=217168 RepID=A0A7W6ICH2_9HYPH|nr:LysE family transporter [Microvirga flocculans]MBB4038902.1 threonine/homoserine/homoserine lactone efflux protein [Microvirga flocculans]